ncbi:MAG: hypothetical protein LBL74_07685 [Bacteroidales bacterium]|nr:hypothetical protein [Bacteroidales bacterium]
MRAAPTLILLRGYSIKIKQPFVRMKRRFRKIKPDFIFTKQPLRKINADAARTNQGWCIPES